ncbi:SHOCT domain-containing protein [Demequina capsici]|uniref:SHOCT domain-containing protein n=1 Tax=Demequina capsici TaxID=3075620 RepID=A0AA96F8S6_9MICO|nr:MULTISPECIES: SHOCT domain-containing protein [unclassified Demequina]WNM23810.1 SHOCT domain-containing protein [Demequina sp. OYTSA14]WNM26649.1 SHOCT domain-containing protein [Demequina sp. PMTSA13]
MPIRVGRPGLIGTMARTAVISGTATAVSGNVARRQAARAQRSAAPAYAEAAYAEPVAAAPVPQVAAPSAGGDLMAQLTKLGEMRAAGLLDDAEFAAAKAKLLA